MESKEVTANTHFLVKVGVVIILLAYIVFAIYMGYRHDKKLQEYERRDSIINEIKKDANRFR